jgi:hypothetical protein
MKSKFGLRFFGAPAESSLIGAAPVDAAAAAHILRKSRRFTAFMFPALLSWPICQSIFPFGLSKYSHYFKKLLHKSYAVYKYLEFQESRGYHKPWI